MTESDTDQKRKKKNHKKKYQQTERVKEQKRELECNITEYDIDNNV